MKTLRNIHFVLFESHLSYSCNVWAQNINAVSRLIILQKETLQIMNLKHQLFHSGPLFSANSFLEFGDTSTSGNIIFVSKSINRQVSIYILCLSILYFIYKCLSLFYDWFAFSVNLKRASLLDYYIDTPG